MPLSRRAIDSKHRTGIIVFYEGTVLNLANAPGHENDRANGPGDYGCVRDPPNLSADRRQRIGFEHPVGESASGETLAGEGTDCGEEAAELCDRLDAGRFPEDHPVNLGIECSGRG